MKPTVPTKVQANGKPTTTFKGRPTSNPTTIAARAKEAGLRIRKDADPADIASRLRATVEATTAWLEARDGSTVKAKPTKAADKAKATPKPVKATEPKAVHVDVTHAWEGAVPKDMPELKGGSLVMRYELQPNGEVWSALWSVLDPDGQRMNDAWKLPLDFRFRTERDGRNRIIKLKGQPIDRSTLTAWLVTQGLVTE